MDISHLTDAGWSLDPSGKAITKQFKFATFRDAIGFITSVAEDAEELDHHPEWTNVYNKIDVRLTTHDADGLTQLDVELAERMDKKKG